MTAQALAGTCAGVASLNGALTRQVNASPAGETVSFPAVSIGQPTFATHSYWNHDLSGYAAYGVDPLVMSPRQIAGQGWPRGNRNRVG